MIKLFSTLLDSLIHILLIKVHIISNLHRWLHEYLMTQLHKPGDQSLSVLSNACMTQVRSVKGDGIGK